jgi:hypothetical protein
MLFWDGSYYIYFTAATSTAARVDVYTNHVGQMDEPLHATNEMPCAIESNTFHLGAGQLDGRKLTIWEHGGRPSSPSGGKKKDNQGKIEYSLSLMFIFPQLLGEVGNGQDLK